MYEEKGRKFPFLARHCFKAELYCYIFIFPKHVRIMLDCINLFLDPQYIEGSVQYVQHKILSWLTLLPLLSLHASRAGKRGRELSELSINFYENTRAGVLF